MFLIQFSNFFLFSISLLLVFTLIRLIVYFFPVEFFGCLVSYSVVCVSLSMYVVFSLNMLQNPFSWTTSIVFLIVFVRCIVFNAYVGFASAVVTVFAVVACFAAAVLGVQIWVWGLVVVLSSSSTYS